MTRLTRSPCRAPQQAPLGVPPATAETRGAIQAMATSWGQDGFTVRDFHLHKNCFLSRRKFVLTDTGRGTP